MKLKLVLFSTACLSFLVIPAAGTSLLAAAAVVKGNAVIGAGLTGAVLSTKIWGEPVIISSQHSQPEVIAVETVPPPHHHQVVVQQPLVHYKPVQTVPLVPIATIPSSYSFTDKVSKLLGGISNAFTVKTRAVSEFLQSFRRPTQIVLVSVDSTTKKPATHKPVHVEVVAVQQPALYPYRVLEDCDKK